jgi:hypothetical protein
VDAVSFISKFLLRGGSPHVGVVKTEFDGVSDPVACGGSELRIGVDAGLQCGVLDRATQVNNSLASFVRRFQH